MNQIRIGTVFQMAFNMDDLFEPDRNDLELK